MVTAIVILLSLCIIAPWSGASAEPLPRLSSIGSVQMPLANEAMRQGVAGIGFDLCWSYGTASVTYWDGSYADVAHIQGGDDYYEMFKRLSLQSSEHSNPPYEYLFEDWIDAPRQAKRKLRKLVGLPASADVGRLSQMLALLREAVEVHLNDTIDTAVVTWPRMRALYQEDILDALEYLGIRSPEVHKYQQLQREWPAVMASERLSFCSTRDNSSCVCGWRKMLTLLYTKRTIQIDFKAWINTFYGGTHGHDEYWTENLDLSLGFDARDDNPDPAYYWNEIRRRFLEIIHRVRYQIPVSDVIFMGESAEEPEFRELIYDLTTRMQLANFTVHATNPLYAAARGAADYHAMVMEQPKEPPNATYCPPGNYTLSKQR